MSPIGTGWPNGWQIVIDSSLPEARDRFRPSAIQWVLQRDDGK